MSESGNDRFITVRGLDHVVLRCVRLEETMRFYCEVLGLVLEREVESIGLYQLRAGDALIDLVPVGGPLGGEETPYEPNFNVAHYCLRIDRPDWESVRTRLASKGIESEPPSRRYGGEGFGQSIYIRDPEGNTVELKSPPE